MKRKLIRLVSGEKDGKNWFAIVLAENFDEAKGEFIEESFKFVQEETWHKLQSFEGKEIVVR